MDAKLLMLLAMRTRCVHVASLTATLSRHIIS